MGLEVRKGPGGLGEIGSYRAEGPGGSAAPLREARAERAQEGTRSLCCRPPLQPCAPWAHPTSRQHPLSRRTVPRTQLQKHPETHSELCANSGGTSQANQGDSQPHGPPGVTPLGSFLLLRLHHPHLPVQHPSILHPRLAPSLCTTHPPVPTAFPPCTYLSIHLSYIHPSIHPRHNALGKPHDIPVSASDLVSEGGFDKFALSCTLRVRVFSFPSRGAPDFLLAQIPCPTTLYFLVILQNLTKERKEKNITEEP